jgi:hypothetical protein
MSPSENTGLKSRQAGLFNGLLRDKLIHSWLSEDGPSFLWVRGAPGQGKTVLSKFLLNHLESQPPNSRQHTSVIYYFFYDQDERFQTIDSFLRSLIKQLLTTPDLSGYIAEVFEVDPSTESEDGLWEILGRIIRVPVFRTIYCVLDALDECKDEGPRKRLLQRITRLLKTPSRKKGAFSDLKLLVTSRPIVDISRELHRFPCIDLKAHPGDLKIFIDSKVTALHHLSADLQKIAAELLLDRAERTFLWVSIVLKKLRTMTFPTLAKLRGIIEESPTDLDKLYLGVINRIMEGSQEEQKLLVWVVYGRRPLTLKELEAALATQMDSKSKASTDEHKIDLTAEAVTSAAGVILEITDNNVHLIHQSAKDFLLRNQQLSYAEFCNGLDPNVYLAKVCMIYLSFEDFEAGPCGDWQTVTARKNQYPLLHYAARNWHAHIRSKEDIDAISHILCRLIEPRSPILLSWGEVAEIKDLQEASDTWGIATKANIAWLAEFKSSTTTITAERVGEMAKNWVTGYSLIERSIRRGDVQFTEGAVHALASNFDEGMMKLLLDRNDGIKVTHELVKAAAANQKNGNYIMRLLLKSSDDIVLTPDLVEVAARNGEGGRDIIELLLRKEHIKIADGAVAEITKRFDAEVMRLLPDERGDIKITKEVVKAVAGSWRSKKVMPLLLNRYGDDIEVTEEMVRIIAQSFDHEVMILLLDRRGDDVKITEKVVKAAAENVKSGEEVITLLLDRRGDDAKVTEEMVRIIAESFDHKVMTLLLDRRGDEIKITEGVFKAAAGNIKSGKEVITLLLDRRGDDTKVTEEMVRIIAQSFDHEAMTLLLDRWGDGIKITDKVFKAAAGNKRGEKIMRLLLDRRGDEVKITDEVVKAAAWNSRGRGIMRLLLDRRGDEVKITDEVVKAAAGNLYGDEEVMRLLLDQRGDEVKITDKVFEVAAWNLRGRGIMRLLLDRRGDEVKITDEVVEEAAGNLHGGEEMMRLLLDRRGDEIKITDEVLKAAVGNGNRAEERIRLLLDRRGDEIKITDEVVTAAAGNPEGGIIMMLLLDRRGDEVKITDEVVKAAAGNPKGEEVIRLLLNRLGNEVKITDEVVKAAAGNPEGEEMMRLLLDRRGYEVKITDEVVKAAAENQYEGEKMMRLLLDQRGDEVKITHEVVTAAVGNGFGGEKVMKLLLDRRGTEVVKAAAGKGGEDVTKLLLNRRGNDIKITEEIIKAAAGNKESGQEVITLLLDRRGDDVGITDEIIGAVGNERSGGEADAREGAVPGVCPA